MGRSDVARKGPLTPDQWPDWVLSFPGALQSIDPRRQAARMIEFRTWRALRAEWFAKRGLDVSVRVCSEEHRRRGMTPLAG